MLDVASIGTVTPRIDCHSHMLKAILTQIRSELEADPTNFGTFVQLLLNLRSCDTSKLNGITNSYLHLQRQQTLRDTDLESVMFRQHLRGFIMNELRILRQLCLGKIVAKDHLSCPHSAHYIRGCLGMEIGIMPKDEKMKIDKDGTQVREKLLSASKQQLLDQFYSYYSVSLIVERISQFLNTGIEGPAKTITDIICKIFKESAMSEDGDTYNIDLILVDEGKPVGFTHEAVKKLLVELQILEIKSSSSK